MGAKENKQEQLYYGHGKLLLTSEYFVVDGALALALPTTVGQSLVVQYKPSYDPYLYWKSYNREKKIWFETQFEFWHFDVVGGEKAETAEVILLQKILRQVRHLNAHFLRDNVDVFVETYLEFDLTWGLGSSSTLIHNIAEWARVAPFELLNRTLGGSGYDIACAEADGPILYKRTQEGPKWSVVSFQPSFSESLYFVYLGKKQNSREALLHYHQCPIDRKKLATKFTEITQAFLKCLTLETFQDLIDVHENLIAESLDLVRVQDQFFPDFWGKVKSLGAWGGDFVLVAAEGGLQRNRDYFTNKGFGVFIPFSEMVRLPEKGSVPVLSLANLQRPFLKEA